MNCNPNRNFFYYESTNFQRSRVGFFVKLRKGKKETEKGAEEIERGYIGFYISYPNFSFSFDFLSGSLYEPFLLPS